MTAKAVITLGILSKGHNGYRPQLPVSASSNVRVHKRYVVREGDDYTGHDKPKSSWHSSTALSRARTRVNRRRLHREDDPITCGDVGGYGHKRVRG